MGDSATTMQKAIAALEPFANEVTVSQEAGDVRFYSLKTGRVRSSAVDLMRARKVYDELCAIAKAEGDSNVVA